MGQCAARSRWSAAAPGINVRKNTFFFVLVGGAAVLLPLEVPHGHLGLFDPSPPLKKPGTVIADWWDGAAHCPIKSTNPDSHDGVPIVCQHATVLPYRHFTNISIRNYLFKTGQNSTIVL